MVKKIKFHISSSGEVTLDVQGAAGKECEKLTEPFESVLGPVQKRIFQDSYYQSEEDNQSKTIESQGE